MKTWISPLWLLLVTSCPWTAVGEFEGEEYYDGDTKVRLRRVYENTPDYECDKVTRAIEVSCPEQYIPWCDEIIYVSTTPNPKSTNDGLVTKYVCPPSVIYCKERVCNSDTSTPQTSSATSNSPPPQIFLPPPIFLVPPPPPPCWCAPMAPICPCPMPMMPPPMMPPPMMPPPMFPPPIFPPIFPPPPPPSPFTSPPPQPTTSPTIQTTTNNEPYGLEDLGRGGMDFFMGMPKNRRGREDSFRRALSQGRMVPDYD